MNSYLNDKSIIPVLNRINISPTNVSKAASNVFLPNSSRTLYILLTSPDVRGDLQISLFHTLRDDILSLPDQLRKAITYRNIATSTGRHHPRRHSRLQLPPCDKDDIYVYVLVCQLTLQ
ncbi:hypothetical protein K443DRAFT_360058 [Laccaria amethystina LaAM-08-1]|uniref:Uncharacterized protein n=1 Tax=Laccaria amethystina LaAM-08-1 TaxID=1095629 RepID=A0A0C9YB34_9AGAR|nr:hypothetical protein K443DRAFT_360058 [Laccaria amethystina LaAM-08-1]